MNLKRTLLKYAFPIAFIAATIAGPALYTTSEIMAHRRAHREFEGRRMGQSTDQTATCLHCRKDINLMEFWDHTYHRKCPQLAPTTRPSQD